MPVTDWGDIVAKTLRFSPPPSSTTSDARTQRILHRCAYCHSIVDDAGGRCPRGCGAPGFRPPACSVCLGPVDAEGACARKCCS